MFDVASWDRPSRVWKLCCRANPKSRTALVCHTSTQILLAPMEKPQGLGNATLVSDDGLTVVPPKSRGLSFATSFSESTVEQSRGVHCFWWFGRRPTKRSDHEETHGREPFSRFSFDRTFLSLHERDQRQAVSTSAPLQVRNIQHDFSSQETFLASHVRFIMNTKRTHPSGSTRTPNRFLPLLLPT